MASQFGDILSDFDLNFFHQTPNAVVNNNFEKQQRAILITKKKIVATNALVKKFYAKKEALDHTEKALFASKEECKQIYIDYTNLIEKFTWMENEVQILQQAKQELQAKYIASENSYAALQSHSNQLQILIKEHETLIESLKIETKLEKCGTKEYEKKINVLKKKNDDLIEHICLATDVILGKKKLSKRLKLMLQKYKKKKSNVKNGEDRAEEDNDCDEMDNFDSSSMSPFYTEDSCDKSQDYPLMNINKESSQQLNENDGKNLLERNDSYLSTRNEVVSVDTGRGSSLAFSDSDKGFHSPEYFNSDNIFSSESCINKKLPKVDRALSPIIFEDSEFIPISYKDCKDVATSPLHFISDNESCINKENPKIDRALSPIIFEDFQFNSIRDMECKDVATSPLNFISDNVIPQVVVDPKVMTEHALSAIPLRKEINVSTSLIGFENEVIDNDQNDRAKEMLSEKECLEMNSSNNTRSDKTGDFEIARILDTMRLTYDLLSPIPKTPIEPHRTGEINPSHGLSDNLNQSENSTGYVCQEAAQLREENKVLHTSIADLTKEVMNIKYLLNRKSIITNDFTNETKESLRNQQKCCRHNSLSCTIDDDTYTIDRNNSENLNAWADSSSALKTSCNLLSEDSLLLLNKEQESQKEINESEVMDLSEEVDDSESVTTDIISFDHDQQNQLYPEEMMEKQESSMDLRDQKIGKVRKLTKLQKLKKQLIPKNNIKRDIVQPKRKRLPVPPKPLNAKKIIKDTDSSVSLNNKDVYEKALKVMAELKSKEDCTKCTNKLNETSVEKLTTLKSASSETKSSNEKQDKNSAIPYEQKSIESQKRPKDSLLLLNKEQESQKQINETEVMNLSEEVIDSESVTTDIISFDHDQQNQLYLGRMLEKQESSIDLHGQKFVKVRKLTKLQKLRKQLIRKNNIKRDIVQPKRKRLSILPNPLNSKKIIKGTESSVSLNNKDVYEKALKVMAELKSKQDSTKCTNKLNETSVKKLTTLKSASSETKNPKSSNEKQDKNSTIPHEQKPIESKSQNSPEKLLISSDSKVNQMCASPMVLINKLLSPNSTNARKRGSLDKPQVESKRVLRSSSIRKLSTDDHSILKKNKHLSTSYANDTHDYDNTIQKPFINDNGTIPAVVINENDFEDTSENNNNLRHSESDNLAQVNSVQKDLKVVPEDGFIKNDVQILRGNDNYQNDIVQYSDLDMFTGDKLSIQNQFEESDAKDSNQKESILCVILEKYGKDTVRVFPKKRADASVVYQDIEEGIKQIMELPPNEVNDGMNKLVDKIRKRSYKSFLAGFMQYLKNPERKIESFNKVSSPPAPPMTKPEQILLYVVTRLKACWPFVDIVNQIFYNIEYTLFKLNDTPTFDVIETMSHFYAVLCRYFKQKTRLRLFVLDAMYCIQFKALPLIKQCLDVWMHILPLAHMGIAKTPLVTCLVYLLHFYKCEDRFKRAQDIRNILNKKYSYQMADWNEKTILEMCKNAIKELKDISSEKKMLRMALIVLAKRRGPRWCQDRIIKNILQPMIENENVPDRIKQFCVSMFGPLLKPYPVEMKIHCEIIINQLLDMLKQNPSAKMEEAIFTSLIYMSKHNYNRIIQALLSWKPRQISPELEELLRDFVREKPAKTWRSILSRISFDD